jgi:aspartyl-tRNA(Asn)/glutamyl-tRNA(Gln) amidotransferase subunit C
MKVDKALVKHVAELANLALTDDEVVHYEKQLGRILDHVAQLSELKDALGADWRGDTKGDPTPERPDIARPSLSPEEAMAEAPRKVGTAFQVPRIIEEH